MRIHSENNHSKITKQASLLHEPISHLVALPSRESVQFSRLPVRPVPMMKAWADWGSKAWRTPKQPPLSLRALFIPYGIIMAPATANQNTVWSETSRTAEARGLPTFSRCPNSLTTRMIQLQRSYKSSLMRMTLSPQGASHPMIGTWFSWPVRCRWPHSLLFLITSFPTSCGRALLLSRYSFQNRDRPRPKFLFSTILLYHHQGQCDSGYCPMWPWICHLCRVFFPSPFLYSSCGLFNSGSAGLPILFKGTTWIKDLLH